MIRFQSPVSFSRKEELDFTRPVAPQLAAIELRTATPKIMALANRAKLAVKGLLTAALAVSFQHQAHFYTAFLRSNAGYVFPVFFDVGMVVCLAITQIKAISPEGRGRANKAFKVFVGASMASNLAASLYPVASWTAFAAGLAYMSLVGLAALLDWAVQEVKIDPKAIAAIEATNAAQLADIEAPADDPAEEARKAERRERDRQRRAAKRRAAEQAALEEAARREAERERRRQRRVELAAQRAAEPVVVPPQPVHVVVPTRPRAGAFGLPRQPLGERVSVLGKPAA
jgi:hypothetical protein